MKEIKLKKVIVQIGNNEVELTMKQAQELYDALGELFPKEIVRHEYILPAHIPVPRWPDPYDYWKPRITWTGSDTGNAVFKLNDNKC